MADLPGSIRRDVERAINEAINPKGMSVHSGMARISAATLQYLLNYIDASAIKITNLKTVMVAAAEEIHEHWDAHCDAEGYGPANLMHRLEKGIPSEYGYTAGAFAQLNQRAEAAEERIRALEQDAAVGRIVSRPYRCGFCMDRLKHALTVHDQGPAAFLRAVVGYQGMLCGSAEWMVDEARAALAAIDAEAK